MPELLKVRGQECAEITEQHPLLVTVDNFRQDTATCSGIINNTDSGSGNNVIATAISNINNSNCNNSSQGNNNITTSASNIHVNALTSDRNDNSSFVRTPPYTEQLSSTVIYIRNGNNHHENYTTQHIPAATSCLVRFRQSCIKFDHENIANHSLLPLFVFIFLANRKNGFKILRIVLLFEKAIRRQLHPW
uniref:Uncharacterized protein n=1 Tax=Glossina palpalis gambiensis TaxID=67801 RepID=A0A1B0AX75_9MUSC